MTVSVGKFVSEARLSTESSSSGSETDSTVQYQGTNHLGRSSIACIQTIVMLLSRRQVRLSCACARFGQSAHGA